MGLFAVHASRGSDGRFARDVARAVGLRQAAHESGVRLILVEAGSGLAVLQPTICVFLIIGQVQAKSRQLSAKILSSGVYLSLALG